MDAGSVGGGGVIFHLDPALAEDPLLILRVGLRLSPSRDPKPPPGSLGPSLHGDGRESHKEVAAKEAKEAGKCNTLTWLEAWGCRPDKTNTKW